MTITTRDQLIDSLGNNSSRIVLDKASLANAVAGLSFSLFRATGVPGQGAIPGAAAVCDHALLGAISFNQQTAPATSYLAWLRLLSGNATTGIEIHDRLAHMGGLSGTVTTAQTASVDVTGSTNNLVARKGDAAYGDVSWWLEIYTDLGATGVNATVNVTYDDASTGNIVIALGATPRAGRMYPIVSAVAGRNPRFANTVTLSATTGTAGSFGITATRLRGAVDVLIANKAESADWALLGLPEIFNSSCLFPVVVCGTTSTGIVRGQGKIAHG